MRRRFASTTGEFPAIVTPTGAHRASAALDAVTGSIDIALTGLKPSAPRRRRLMAAAAAALAVIAGGVALAYALKPAEVIPQPIALPPPPPKEDPEVTPDAGAPVETATVDAGTPRPGALTAKPRGKGKLELRVKPWGEVFIGTKSIGITPFAPVELPAGKYTLTIKNPKLGKVRNVPANVEPGKTTVVRVDLAE
jgi:serine/threonine-protein kinase